MRKSLHFILCFSILLLAKLSWSQGTIVNVIPSAAAKNSTVSVIIRGSGTNFIKNATTVSFSGKGVAVNGAVNVNSPEMITCQVTIAGDAEEGTHEVDVTVNGKTTITYPLGINVISTGSADPTVTLIAFPYQSISLSDFDPNKLNSSPLLFTVTVYSGGKTDSMVTAKFSLSNDQYGVIGTASKFLGNLKPGDAPKGFNNREFDSYKINDGQKDFVDKAIKTGTLPGGTYTYTIDLFDKSNKLIGHATAINVVSNQLTRPDLISPGNGFNLPAPTLRTKLPLFQWFSQGGNFDIIVYPVNPGQTTPEEISMNRPIHIVRGHTSTSFLYPANAELLEEGKTYAWQVKLNTNGSSGATQLPSEMFWFRYSAAGAPQLTVADLKITPDDVEVGTKQTQKFAVSGFTANNEPVPNVKVEWRITPTDMGSIDASGLFTANGKPGSVAVIAKYGDLQEYATVSVVNMGGTDATGGNMNKFLQLLFGLPQK